MNFSPTLSEVKRIADTGRYDVLPVSCEILSTIGKKTPTSIDGR